MQLLQFKGFASNAYFSDALDGLSRALWEEKIRNRPQAYVDDFEEACRRLKESRDNVLLMPEFETSDLYKRCNMPCQLTESKAALLKANAGIAFQKGSPLLRVFRAFVNRALETGVLHRLDRIFLKSLQRPCAIADASEIEAVGYGIIFTSFLVIVIGIVSSMLLVLFENFRSARLHCLRQMQKKNLKK